MDLQQVLFPHVRCEVAAHMFAATRYASHREQQRQWCTQTTSVCDARTLPCTLPRTMLRAHQLTMNCLISFWTCQVSFLLPNRTGSWIVALVRERFSVIEFPAVLFHVSFMCCATANSHGRCPKPILRACPNPQAMRAIATRRARALGFS